MTMMLAHTERVKFTLQPVVASLGENGNCGVQPSDGFCIARCCKLGQPKEMRRRSAHAVKDAHLLETNRVTLRRGIWNVCVGRQLLNGEPPAGPHLCVFIDTDLMLANSLTHRRASPK